MENTRLVRDVTRRVADYVSARERGRACNAIHRVYAYLACVYIYIGVSTFVSRRVKEIGEANKCQSVQSVDYLFTTASTRADFGPELNYITQVSENLARKFSKHPVGKSVCSSSLGRDLPDVFFPFVRFSWRRELICPSPICSSRFSPIFPSHGSCVERHLFLRK